MIRYGPIRYGRIISYRHLIRFWLKNRVGSS